jgi:uncharacterized Zn finger protein
MSRYSSYYYKPTRPIETDKGLKARSQTGKFGQSWWAARWIAALERLLDAGRLRRGSGYARSGQVLSIEETPTGVLARVQGSRPQPYKVAIELKRLTDDQWAKVLDQMAAQAGFSAQLLAGEMPQDIEEAFKAAGISLFPDRVDDLTTACSCPDWANPCKHVAATHFILGEQFDEDPFMIFRLRGRTQEEIMQALRSRRGGAEEEEAESVAAPAEPVAALAELLDRFWQPLERLDAFAAAVKPPAVRFPLLKRLGQPAFLPDDDLVQTLGSSYEAITAAALRAAFEGGPARSGDRGERETREFEGGPARSGDRGEQDAHETGPRGMPANR